MTSQRSRHQAKNALSRRGLLSGSLAAAAVGAAAPSATAATQTSRNITTTRGSNSRTKLVLLGTAGGPGWLPESQRQGISSAVVIGDRYYLVDAGDGVGHQLRKAGLGSATVPAIGPLDKLNAVFLTHLHSDHVADLSNLFQLGPHNGLQLNDRLPVQLDGPGDRGALPPVFGPQPAPPVVAPENPTPGTVRMWDHLVKAFATDFNDRARDNGLPVPSSLVEAHDIPLSPELRADANNNPHPSMQPIVVHEDERVRVSATLVQHAPVFPAFAFRFDSDDGSVVFSGDTSPSDNLVRLAEGADVLVHEVISRQFLQDAFPQPRTPAVEGVLQHLLSAHTAIEDVGPIAERAGVSTLVLNHLVPANWPDRLWRQAQQGFTGELIVGHDLDVIGVGGPRTGRTRLH